MKIRQALIVIVVPQGSMETQMLVNPVFPVSVHRLTKIMPGLALSIPGASSVASAGWDTLGQSVIGEGFSNCFGTVNP